MRFSYFGSPKKVPGLVCVLLLMGAATRVQAFQELNVVNGNMILPASYIDGCADDDSCIAGCDIRCDAGCSDGSCGPGGCNLIGDAVDGILGSGLLMKSECEYSDFISPTTNPVYFEDPRQLTELRPVFIQHRLPPALGAGTVQVIAVQARVRISERLSIIAIKDGFVTASPAAPLDDGWADIAAGFKYSLYRNACCGRLLSVGATYELPSGERSALQGNGDGEFNMFASYGTRIGCRSHWISTLGFRLPANIIEESQSVYWSNHLDYRLNKKLYAFTEFNYYHYTKSGGGGYGLSTIEGGDLFNLGSDSVTGNSLVTGAIGLKYKT